ncbi:MAG: hypothetical protein JSV88_28410 [Candidatus Aminicenantes bacterium]|nr:MAG: hypothetical protein JSV88_28410 [Candidatus Aminicenantes bacterium]
MEKVVEGFFKNGEIFLFDDIKMKFAKVKVIFQEEEDDKADRGNDFLLKNRLKVRTRNFKFNRDELYDRKGF